MRTPGAGRKLDLEVVAEEEVIALQRLDEQEVHRKPDRAAPVRVATEELAARLARLVVDAVHRSVDLQQIGVLEVVARQRADAER
jgi:hypothetical protein